MQIHLWRGFNRLFLALAIGWTIICTVAFPEFFIYKTRLQFETEHQQNVNNCYKDYGIYYTYSVSKCLDSSDETLKNEEELYSQSLLRSYMSKEWKNIVVLIVLPLSILYILAVALKWVWRGFRPK